jgi:cobalamin biosynthesis protein CobD/CbiB
VIIFSRAIVEATYIEWPPWIGPAYIIAKLVNYIIRKSSNKSSHEIQKISGEYIFMWILRIWGGWVILLGFFGIYLMLSKK